MSWQYLISLYGKILLSWWSQDRGNFLESSGLQVGQFKTTVIWKHLLCRYQFCVLDLKMLKDWSIIIDPSQIKLTFSAPFLILSFNILYFDRLWRSTCSCFKTKDIWARRGKYLQLCKTILCVWSCFQSFWLDYKLTFRDIWKKTK